MGTHVLSGRLDSTHGIFEFVIVRIVYLSTEYFNNEIWSILQRC